LTSTLTELAKYGKTKLIGEILRYIVADSIIEDVRQNTQNTDTLSCVANLDELL